MLNKKTIEEVRQELIDGGIDPSLANNLSVGKLRKLLTRKPRNPAEFRIQKILRKRYLEELKNSKGMSKFKEYLNKKGKEDIVSRQDDSGVKEVGLGEPEVMDEVVKEDAKAPVKATSDNPSSNKASTYTTGAIALAAGATIKGNRSSGAFKDTIKANGKLKPTKPIVTKGLVGTAMATAGIGLGSKMLQGTDSVAKVADSIKVDSLSDASNANSMIGSPVINEMNSLTKDIDTELDALRAMHQEQLKHNGVSEKFMETMLIMMQSLLEGTSSGLINDVERNKLMVSQIRAEVDNAYAKKMVKSLGGKPEDLRGSGGVGLFGDIADKTSDFMSRLNLFGKNGKSESSGFRGNSSSVDSTDAQVIKFGEKSKSEGLNLPFNKLASKISKVMLPTVAVPNGGKPSPETVSNLARYDQAAVMAQLGGMGKAEGVSKDNIRRAMGYKDNGRRYKKYATYDHAMSLPIVANNQHIGYSEWWVPKPDKDGRRIGDTYRVNYYSNGDVQYLIDNNQLKDKPDWKTSGGTYKEGDIRIVGVGKDEVQAAPTKGGATKVKDNAMKVTTSGR